MISYYDKIKKGFRLNSSEGVLYLSVPTIDELGIYKNAFTTRVGGVSEGRFSSLNLSLTRETNRANVAQNYKKLANALGLPLETFTACHYEHGNGVCEINKDHLGAGILRENPLPFCDGVITRHKGVTAVTMHADCTPLFFADKLGRACGVCHAGWKGTYLKISQNMVKMMGVNPADILVGIGPVISKDKFEVQEDVGGLFYKEYGSEARIFKDGKQFVDLQYVTAMQLCEAGIPSENITAADLCTYTFSELFYSHRRDKGNTGAMASVIAFK